MRSLAAAPLWGLWFAFLALPFSGLEGSLRIGLACALVVGAARLAGVVLRAEAVAPRVAKGRETVAELWESFLRGMRDKRVAPFVLLGIMALPWWLGRYETDVLVIAGIYVMLALGLNVVVGFAGLLDLGYVAFYAVGAYSYALLNTWLGLPFWPALLGGAALSAAFGILLGIPVLRLRGDYLAIVTLGFGEIIRIVLNNWDDVTRGPNGILGIGRPLLGEFRLSQPMHFFYLVLALCLFTIFIVNRLNRSRIGRAWAAMREDESAAECMGVDLVHAKLTAFAFGASWAGLAGVVFAAKQTFVSPESFSFFESVIILCMVVLGGMGSVPGVILGALILIILPEMLREITFFRPMLLGGALVLMMALRPQGFLEARGLRLAEGALPPEMREKAERTGR